MVISKTKPPNWDRLRAAFGFDEKGTIFTYDGVLYNPTGYDIPEDLVAHEETHVHQQSAVGGADAWYDKYLEEPEFRLDQELEAYRVQWRYIVKTIRDRNRQAARLRHMAETLSGPTYGHLVSLAEAMRLIRQ